MTTKYNTPAKSVASPGRKGSNPDSNRYFCVVVKQARDRSLGGQSSTGYIWPSVDEADAHAMALCKSNNCDALVFEMSPLRVMRNVVDIHSLYTPDSKSSVETAGKALVARPVNTGTGATNRLPSKKSKKAPTNLAPNKKRGTP